MSKRSLFVGVDLGGTDIKATATDREGNILVTEWSKILSHVGEGPQRTIEQLALAADTAVRIAGGTWDDVINVGLATPGPASLDGVLARSANLKHPGWTNFPIRAALEDRVGKPVLYANDANAAGYWEYYRLYRDDSTKVVGAVTMGTGLGGALVMGGELVVGALGYGAEFGHVRLPGHAEAAPLLEPGQSEPLCGCGKKGCAEAYASLSSLDKFLRQALALPRWKEHPLQTLADIGRGRAEKLLGLAQKGDELSLLLFDNQARALGLLFGVLANVFDPHIFLIGGGLSETNDAFRTRFLGIVGDVFRRESFPLQAEKVVIDWAGDLDHAGSRGAALLARRAATRSA